MTIKLNLPVTEEEIRKLKVGDEVLLSGRMVTARDKAHKFMVDKKPDFLRPHLKDTIIYHCGPVVAKSASGYEFVAAGPTTSAREEIYQDKVLREYQVRGVIGKGGMGEQTLKALQEVGAVYFHAIGGAAQVLAKAVVRVHDVWMLEEFGVPEAFWLIEVKDFPVVVTMDSHGNSLHTEMKKRSDDVMRQIFQSM